MKKNKYYCKKCGKTMRRLSSKKWMKSFCAETGQYTRIYKIK